ncbi:annexin A5b isoform X2 [Cynoglossus semilaevis]|uniref:annexin A5b isoform X2 n=1 Tax=Cynoglossus semilaevis TaxID=244447 RepID=UPI000D62864A|nr:annexin A5 isoform X2 [Cynoglossus semilaevis]
MCTGANGCGAHARTRHTVTRTSETFSEWVFSRSVFLSFCCYAPSLSSCSQTPISSHLELCGFLLTVVSSFITVNMASIRPSGNFNSSEDAEALRKAMRGLGTDEDAILALLTARSNAQRQEIKTAYKTLFGKDLISDLKGELGGKFETLIVALMTPPLEYDVSSLRNAIKGAGTDEKVLVQILASRTPDQVRQIVAAYRKEYDDDLEEDICGDTSGHFKRLLVVLLQANRQRGIQESEIENDAQVLFQAGEKKFGTDEQMFVTILGNRSSEHLRKVFDAYMKLSGYEMEESIKRETSGSLRDLLLAVVKCARSVPTYFAETLYYSMKGMGTDDDTLIRVMVTRSEVDMMDIRGLFRKLFGTSLHKMIKGDTSGDYRKALLLLCGGDDA